MSPEQRIHIYDSTTLPLDYVKAFDVQIADPPYRKHVHDNATSQSAKRGTRKRDLGFASLSVRLRRFIVNSAMSVRRWSVIYSDVEESYLFRLGMQARGGEYVRTIPWVRWSMPQLHGDRPPQGFEHVVLLHPKGRKRWSGPGNLTHFNHTCLRGEDKHKAEKPLDQMLDVVSFFTEPGENIFDPCAGRGTVGVACRLLGRNYVGFEVDPAEAEKAQKRLIGDPEDVDRIMRWLETDSEPVSALPSGPSLLRAERRAKDKENVRKGVFL